MGAATIGASGNGLTAIGTDETVVALAVARVVLLPRR